MSGPTRTTLTYRNASLDLTRADRAINQRVECFGLHVDIDTVRRRPAYATGFGKRDEAEALPTVRSVFVDPAAARRGIASSIMTRIERDALDHCMRDIALTATLSGAALYERLGYLAQGREQLPLNTGSSFGCIRMNKLLKRSLDQIPESVAWRFSA
ncbi:GNAT family N-acetyltransferase [Rhizobium arsenicireducens]